MVLGLVNSVGLPISPQTHLEYRKQIAWVRCCCDYDDHATVNTFTINIFNVMAFIIAQESSVQSVDQRRKLLWQGEPIKKVIIHSPVLCVAELNL